MTAYHEVLAVPAMGSVQCDPPTWCWRATEAGGYCRREISGDPLLGLCDECIAALRGDGRIRRVWRKVAA